MSDRALCPSGRPTAGALLIGMVGADGAVHHLRSPLLVGDEFSPGRDETRFRFAEPCAKQRCGHWGDDRCGLIDALLDRPSEPEPLVACGLRARCVWFAQRGASACTTCRHVTRRPDPARKAGAPT